MAQEFTYPVSAVPNVVINAEGPNGAPAPSESLQVGGVGPDGNLHPLATDNSGVLQVDGTGAGGATAANQVTEINLLTSRLSGALVPAAFDEVDLTYVPSGPGAGQVATATYKLSGSTVKTLTLTYDGSDRLSTVVAS